MPTFVVTGAFALVLAVAGSDRAVAAPAAAAPPNVVIMFVDDLGWADLGCTGAVGYATPNLDRMAREGSRFTSFYVAQPVCSASRAGLLTGCYPNRVGIAGALGPNAKHGLKDQETTIAEVLKSKGYATACFGKWHLGHRPEFLPPRHGFDEYLGIPYSNDMWPRHPDYVDLPPDAEGRKRGYPELPLIENDAIVDPAITGEVQAQFTRMFTERAVDFIERHRDEPFFLYVPHPMPHVPIFASERFRGTTERGLYGDVIAEIDWSMGEILGTLQRLGLDERTLVIFASDNGPWTSYGDHAGSVGPLREAKGTTWEGGVRVPCIVRWPGRVPADRICDVPFMTIDLLPTIAGLAGAPLPPLPIDGRDAWPLLSGAPGASSPQEAYFFWYQVNALEAVRSGRWKLTFPHRYRTLSGRPGGTDGRPAPYDQVDCGIELHDLVADPGETLNFATVRPDVVARLTALADRMRAELGDALTGVEGSARR